MASAASTAGIIASGVAAPLAALYVGQRSVIYPRPPVYDDAKAYGGEHAEVVRADGVVGLFVPPPKADEQIIAVYFHGNADQITWGGAMIGKELRERGIGTFAAEYPGYGLADGDPTEASITRAAEAALRAVKEPTRGEGHARRPVDRLRARARRGRGSRPARRAHQPFYEPRGHGVDAAALHPSASSANCW